MRSPRSSPDSSGRVRHDYVSALPHFNEKGYSLDRADNSLGYQPGNVRWATQSEQIRNTRVNHLITYAGKTKCLTEWAEEFSISPNILSGRLGSGWEIEDALTRPTRKMSPPKRSAYKGVSWHKHSRKWTAQIGVNGKKRYLGVFESEEDAAEAYAKAFSAVHDPDKAKGE